MRETGRTPSEWFETEEKFENRKLAEFYRCFLDIFKKEILDQAPGRDESLGELLSDRLIIKQCSDKAIKEASEKTGIDKHVEVDVEEISKMKPSEFGEYIDKLKSSLSSDEIYKVTGSV